MGVCEEQVISVDLRLLESESVFSEKCWVI